jgi:hypothetical protein
LSIHLVEECVQWRPRERRPGDAGEHDSVLGGPGQRGEPERVVVRWRGSGIDAVPNGGDKVGEGLPAWRGSGSADSTAGRLAWNMTS